MGVHTCTITVDLSQGMIQWIPLADKLTVRGRCALTNLSSQASNCSYFTIIILLNRNYSRTIASFKEFRTWINANRPSQ